MAVFYFFCYLWFKIFSEVKMTTDIRLQKLKNLKERLKILEKRTEETYAFWSLFRYYAQQEDWWTDFIHKLWIPWSELKFAFKSFGEPSMAVTWEEGERLWEQRQNSLMEYSLALQEIISLVKELYIESGYSLELIGKYYGASASAISQFLKDHVPEYQEIKRTNKTS